MNAAEVKEIRLRLGLSQEEFGPAIGFAPGLTARMRVSEIETGRRAISLKVGLLLRYVDFYGKLPEND